MPYQCPNCDCYMNEGECCPECEHSEDVGEEDCDCEFCLHESGEDQEDWDYSDATSYYDEDDDYEGGGTE